MIVGSRIGVSFSERGNRDQPQPTATAGTRQHVDLERAAGLPADVPRPALARANVDLIRASPGGFPAGGVSRMRGAREWGNGQPPAEGDGELVVGAESAGNAREPGS